MNFCIGTSYPAVDAWNGVGVGHQVVLTGSINSLQGHRVRNTTLGLPGPVDIATSNLFVHVQELLDRDGARFERVESVLDADVVERIRREPVRTYPKYVSLV